MTFAALRPIVTALMYEGFRLYPYRRSAIKNRYGWLFGTVYPCAYAEAAGGADRWWTQTECLVEADREARCDIAVRFLQCSVSAVDVAAAGRSLLDVVEREVALTDESLASLLERPTELEFAFPSADELASRPARLEPIEGAVDVAAEPVDKATVKLRVRVRNLTSLHTGCGRDAALPRSLLSVHTLLGVRGGAFVSVLDPPDRLSAAAGGLRNVGTWPVLAGARDTRDLVLASPIILPDYPQIAPESPRDFFDATEIDELLTLRVLTLTDEEKRALVDGDVRVRALLQHVEASGLDDLRRLHGAVRTRSDAPPPSPLQPGARVRLRPAGRADIMDLVLAGKTATVLSLEEDYDGRGFVTVSVDDDPGGDLGARGMPGHRFFFRPDEIELLP